MGYLEFYLSSLAVNGHYILGIRLEVVVNLAAKRGHQLEAGRVAEILGIKMENNWEWEIIGIKMENNWNKNGK
jgi:hypothetical protein